MVRHRILGRYEMAPAIVDAMDIYAEDVQAKDCIHSIDAIHVSLTQRLTSRPRVRPVVQFFAPSFEMMTMYRFMFESAVRVGSERANLPKRDNHFVKLVLGMIIAVKFPAVVAEHSQL